MVRSDRDHGYSGPCRLFCKSDGRRASADLCWTSGRSCQSSELRRGSVCGTAGLQRLAALPETVARRPISGLNPDPSSDSNPDCATSAQHLHSLQPTLHAASGPATLWRTPGTRCERGRRAARQSRSHQLATVPQTIADRSFLEQIATQLESNLLSSGGLGVFERASCLHLARSTVPLPTPHSAATFKMPLPARNGARYDSAEPFRRCKGARSGGRARLSVRLLGHAASRSSFSRTAHSRSSINRSRHLAPAAYVRCRVAFSSTLRRRARRLVSRSLTTLFGQRICNMLDQPTDLAESEWLSAHFDLVKRRKRRVPVTRAIKFHSDAKGFACIHS